MRSIHLIFNPSLTRKIIYFECDFRILEIYLNSKINYIKICYKVTRI